VGARILERIGELLGARRRRSHRKRSKVVSGASLGSAGLIFRRESPDGRVFVVAFHLPRRVWRAKESGSSFLYEAPRLRDAIADAAGDDPDASWIRRIEAEVTVASGRASESPASDRDG
jgi:hypothetical protein